MSLALRERDLSNRKLAQNQTELSQQILELRSAVEAQGEIIRRLVGMLEDGGVVGVGTSLGKEMEAGRMVKGKGRERVIPNSHANASVSCITGRDSMS